MILHLFPQEKFTVPYIKFINNNFNNENHMFFIYGNNSSYVKSEINSYNNIVHINKKEISKFIGQTYKAEKIILHSLFFNKWLLMYFFFNKCLLYKCNWVIWGADLYHYKYKKEGVISRIYEYVRGTIIKNVGGLITHIEGDYNLARKWYGAKGKYLYSFMYPSNTYKNYQLYRKNNDIIFIQVGNSADPTNNHIEVFNKIKKYANKNIKIICPLSYGDKAYRNIVITEGEKIFGDKFKPLLEFIDYNSYLDILSKVDIAIFNHDRQQAVGNIITLLGLGKKVYIRNDITTWGFCEKHSLKVFDINNKYESLLDIIDGNYSEYNIGNISKLFSEDKLLLDWKKIFES